jgi:hypothetical protein
VEVVELKMDKVVQEAEAIELEAAETVTVVEQPETKVGIMVKMAEMLEEIKVVLEEAEAVIVEELTEIFLTMMDVVAEVEAEVQV